MYKFNCLKCEIFCWNSVLEHAIFYGPWLLSVFGIWNNYNFVSQWHFQKAIWNYIQIPIMNLIRLEMTCHGLYSKKMLFPSVVEDRKSFLAVSLQMQ